MKGSEFAVVAGMIGVIRIISIIIEGKKEGIKSKVNIEEEIHKLIWEGFIIMLFLWLSLI